MLRHASESGPQRVPDKWIMRRQHHALKMVYHGLGRLRQYVREGRYDELDKQCVNIRKSLGRYLASIVEVDEE